MSCSELYVNALKAHLEKYRSGQILQKLNQVYTEEPSDLEPVMAKMQFIFLPPRTGNVQRRNVGGVGADLSNLVASEPGYRRPLLIV